jgi:hypothetical protein
MFLTRAGAANCQMPLPHRSSAAPRVACPFVRLPSTLRRGAGLVSSPFPEISR